EADLEAVGYDEKRHRHLDAVRESAVRLQGERKHLADALRRAEEAAIAWAAAEKSADQARVDAAHADELKRQAEETQTLAEQALRAAEEAHRAAHLRTGLRAGQPCPVCCQDVAALPEENPVPELTKCRAALDAAKKELARAARATSKKDRALAAAAEMARAASAQAESEKAGAVAR